MTKTEELANVLEGKGVVCRIMKPIHADAFIAVFTAGSMTVEEIAKKMKEYGQTCIFFKGNEKRFYGRAQ